MELNSFAVFYAVLWLYYVVDVGDWLFHYIGILFGVYFNRYICSPLLLSVLYKRQNFWIRFLNIERGVYQRIRFYFTLCTSISVYNLWLNCIWDAFRNCQRLIKRKKAFTYVEVCGFINSKKMQVLDIQYKLETNV